MKCLRQTLPEYQTGASVMRKIIAVVMLCLLAAQRADADLIIDQQNPYIGGPVNGFEIPLFEPIGQTFIPTFNSMNVVILNLQDLNHRGGPWAVEVHAGLDGALLGTSQAVDLPADFGAGQTAGLPVEFDFASSIALTPGLTYSLEPIRFNGSAFNLMTTVADGYPQGSLFLKGSIQPGDAIFSEGLSVSSVPEPSTFILCGSTAVLAIAGAGLRLLRMRMAAVRGGSPPSVFFGHRLVKTHFLVLASGICSSARSR
jgi:hypothetical protein